MSRSHKSSVANAAPADFLGWRSTELSPDIVSAGAGCLEEAAPMTRQDSTGLCHSPCSIFASPACIKCQTMSSTAQLSFFGTPSWTYLLPVTYARKEAGGRLRIWLCVVAKECRLKRPGYDGRAGRVFRLSIIIRFLVASCNVQIFNLEISSDDLLL